MWREGETHMETGKSAGSREVLEKGGLCIEVMARAPDRGVTSERLVPQ